ncbi:TVP38/TMEM64 family protein [Cerasibacillus terrae]|uniref:TVP38/TMEM64 family membrane protein n=1 Tax=Cerasibacillus terrae TaxID=2498845 RepID=A0A5C8NQI5_9BACI|nr:TVP38/TMEM64 family protein [Cerasibacillus terrae]TXL64009.1 TVP38/TMEM64 family protein [Cerasibacillus terrae]
MYVYNILTDWKQFYKEGNLDEYIIELLDQYQSLGPLPGIFLPFIESFFPFLPLFVFVFANAAAYGLLQGFIFSWIGSILGDITVFMIIRKLGKKRIFNKLRKNKQVHKVTKWVERHGFGPLFVLLCFPFSPSSVINVVSGLSKIRVYQYVLAILLGKAVMIFSMAYVGSSIIEFAKNPQKTILIAIFIGMFWLIGKYIEKRLHKKTNYDSMETSVKNE